MIQRIKRKKYDIYAFDLESHNDEESIAKNETSMWLGCMINEKSTMNDDVFFYDIDSFIDKLEEMSSKKRKKMISKNIKRRFPKCSIWKLSAATITRRAKARRP